MKVKLLNYTKDSEKIVAQSARLCYSESGIDELNKKLTDKSRTNLIEKIIKLGHYSVLEHATFTFVIEGISRVTSHQLVRHRLASFSQQSQRYVKISEEGFPYIVPKSIAHVEKLNKIFIDALKKLDRIYHILLVHNIEAEDARYILPQAVTTKMIISANARELLLIFKLRCCNRAQWEIREVAINMLREVKKIAPTIFENAGPLCILGPCPEGELSCGKPWSNNKEKGVNG